MNFQDASEFLKTEIQTVINLADIYELHRIHNKNAVVMICSDSLFSILNSSKHEN
jgi:hypothetical protein